jgi:PAS domain S-box-containing protein
MLTPMIAPIGNGPVDPNGPPLETLADVPASILETIGQSLGWRAGSLWEELGWEHGSFWAIDRDGALLRCVDVWTAPGVAAGELEERWRRLSYHRGEGLPGRVWATGEPLVVGDLAMDDPAMRELPGQLGQRRAIAIPIRDSGTVTGVIELWGRETGQTEGDVLPMMQRVAGQISQLLDRRRTADAVRESETRKAALLEAALDSIITLDDEGKITEFNPAAEKTLGHNRTDVLGRQLAEVVFPPALRDEYRRWLEYSQEDRLQNKRLEATAMRADGTELSVEVAVTSVRLGQGLEYTVYIHDVTERKLTDERLRDTLANLQLQVREAERARGEALAVLDATSEAMILLSPDRRFISVNQRFEDLFGTRRVRLVGQRLDELWPDLERVFADREGFRDLISRATIDESRRFTEMLTQLWPEARELELTSSPVHTRAGEHLGRLFVFRDVTREREVDRMKTEFVSLVSHELRTPLTSIKGYVDLLLDEEAGAITEQQRQFMVIVKNNADRLVGLINDLLDIARIEAGKVEIRHESLQLPALIQVAANGLLRQIEAKGQHFSVDLAPELPPLLGDQGRVIQILTNLLSNAHKYTQAGGSIVIAARRDGGEVRVEVRDTGIGLTAEEQSQLFAKFFRATNRATQEVGGTGLGLAITRSLVQMHGGQITVQSAPGEGSTFSFTLPIVPPRSGWRNGNGPAVEEGG